MSENTTLINLLVVVASVRTDRVGHLIGRWVGDRVRDSLGDSAVVRDVDLREVALPADAELVPGGGASTPVSERVAEADGFVIVTPEYNHAYPAALKRFIDWHYAEWQFKAATVVPYGVQGGLLAGEFLRPVLAELSVVTTRRMVGLRAPWARIGTSDDGRARFDADDGERRGVRDAVGELAWWSETLRDARTRRPFTPAG
ncbi:NADPH-dependent FMN reductase [Williamsia sterculiae]|uniref:NAD(P)H-dependent FMN reductase n=1 Tax=Williamsia sterculiae TaxID=1344003 RepID=A0A1N7DYJ2_9NOCA|nr:NAD(P)H-dependent oxidoreductase [Williamsia sterculiae]SIR80910.1 NAD(P)H-dependent FMN reductase [Williamsia sterculiae]